MAILHRPETAEMKPGGKHSEATKALMRLHHVGMSGRKHSEETKAKMRDSNKDQRNVFTPEWYRNLVLAHRTKEYRQKRRELRLGEKTPEEIKQRISEGLLKYWAIKRSAIVCIYLTDGKHSKYYSCMNNLGNCRKKSSIACPLLEIELKKGEQIDRIRLEKRIRDMTPEYYHWFYISLPPHERKEAQDIYAKLHNIPVEILDSPGKVSADDTFRSKTRMIREKNLTRKN